MKRWSVVQVLLGLLYAVVADRQSDRSARSNIILQRRPQHALGGLQLHVGHHLPS